MTERQELKGLYKKRVGFWIRIAREREGWKQQALAEALGLSGNSKSSVSDYENGVTLPDLPTLDRIAGLLNVPLETFTRPKRTAFELIDARLAELASRAGDAEQADWEQGQDRGRGDADAPADAPDRRSA